MVLWRIMIKILTLGEKEQQYTLRVSTRARSMRIVIHHDGSMVVIIPRNGTEKHAEEFILTKSLWIEKVLKKVLKNHKHVVKHTQEEITEYTKQVEAFVFNKLLYFNQTYGFAWKKIAVKNVSSRWGSCSSKGNIYFNYKLVLLPEHLVDYIVVHELCHLRECNHSVRFWALVEKTIPDYKERRRELRRW